MHFIKRLTKAVFPLKYHASLNEFINNTFDRYALTSYAQEGEDMILRRLFENRQPGFYVDVGAHHPKRFSNTYFFYKQGWRGINIDAMPGSMKLFERYRPRDINLEIAIGDSEETLPYYIFDEPALNGFSESISIDRNQASPFKLMAKQDLQTQTLETVLNNHLPANQKIDFFSVDAEGWDLIVLQSNNWKKYRPEVVLVEILHGMLNRYIDDPIAKFLMEQGYSPYAKSTNTWIFKIDDLDE